MTTSFTLHVDNLKCGGCANTIRKALSHVPGVSAVEVRPETSEVSFEAALGGREAAAEKLRSLGYPETGSLSGLSANIANAKSYVSCAIGKLG